MKTCCVCKESLDESWFHQNKGILRSECKTCRNKLQKDTRSALRLEVINHYGGPKCQSCSNENFKFLQINHLLGGGNEHRRQELGSNKGGYHFYIWLKRNGFPSGYNVLCKWCNQKYQPELKEK